MPDDEFDIYLQLRREANKVGCWMVDGAVGGGKKIEFNIVRWHVGETPSPIWEPVFAYTLYTCNRIRGIRPD